MLGAHLRQVSKKTEKFPHGIDVDRLVLSRSLPRVQQHVDDLSAGRPIALLHGSHLRLI